MCFHSERLAEKGLAEEKEEEEVAVATATAPAEVMAATAATAAWAVLTSCNDLRRGSRSR